VNIKNKICVLLALILTVLCLPSGVIAASSLIKNGDFEKNIDNWSGTRASMEHIKTGAHLNSAGCMKVKTTSAYGLVSQTVELEKNIPYQVTMWLKLEEGASAVNAQIIMGHSGSEYGYVAAGTRVTDEWTKLSATYKYTGKNKTGRASFYVQLDYNNGCPPITYYMDDVSVTAIGNSGPVYRETEFADNEIAQNIGFDDGIDGYITKNAGIAVTEGDGYENSRFSARVSGTGDFGSVGQLVKMERGKKYTLSAAVKMEKGQSEFTFAVNNGLHTEYLQTSGMVYDSWKKVSVDYLYTGADNSDVSVMIRAGKSKVTFHLDDFSILAGELTELPDDMEIPENQNNQCRVAVNNKILESTVKPYINNNYMLAELSVLAEKLNLRYSVDSDVITVKRGRNRCVMTVGSSFASDKNGTAQYIEPPVLKYGRVMVPVGFLLKNLGFEYSYEDETKTVLVTADEPDSRLSSVIQASESGKLTVGYIGGEVTNGEFMTNNRKNSWRAKTTAWLTEYFDTCEVTEVNASVSYTDSELALYRVQQDLLDYNPDIVFIDFAPNDANKENAAEVMEGLVRKIKMHNNDIAIVAVNTVSTDMAKEYIANVTPSVITAYAEIFDYYNILTVDAGKILASKIGNADAVKNYIAYDSIAKNNAHSVYASEVTAQLDKALTNADRYHPSELKSALYGGYENCTLIPAKALSGAGFELAEDNEIYLHSNTPGSELKYTFTGESIGIYWQSGPDTGDIEYSIDGKVFKTVTTATGKSSRFYRAGYVMLEEGLADKEHTVTIRVKNSKDVSSSGYNIRIYGLMVK